MRKIKKQHEDVLKSQNKTFMDFFTSSEADQEELELSDSKYDENGNFVPFGYATSYPDKKPLLFERWFPVVHRFDYSDDDISHNYYDSFNNHDCGIRTDVNPATGLMTASEGGIDAGGNAYGTNGNWY